MANGRIGRRKGGRNKGYWFRAGRGWYATENGRPVALLDETGCHLRDKGTEDEVQRAYARWLLGREKREQDERQNGTGDMTPMMEVCRLYLDWAKANRRAKTYALRANFLFDFCTGFPARFRGGKDKPTAKDRIHKGYGAVPVCDLKPIDIDQWLASHTWGSSTQYAALASIKVAINYSYKGGLIGVRPIYGKKAGYVKRRITYFTPEVEEALYRHAGKAFGTALRVCIRTGARPGAEFASLTSAHVQETDRGMVWRFSAEESKTAKPRIIYIAPEVAEIVRAEMKRQPAGTPIFRNKRGEPWDANTLGQAFRQTAKRLERKEGIKLEKGDVMYTTRHTFARRTLSGFWTGRPTTIETLAGLMGNSREVCWHHYAQWCDMYTDPLWDAISGKASATADEGRA